ncbi:zinc finger MYM-type protein 1-like [Watersipora subatra]|uniref:zinc finger MYM-type protein 1-like n=1 Tax=Watersipora subatra TaxID=2589382 RepID=UPI00355B439E
MALNRHDTKPINEILDQRNKQYKVDNHDTLCYVIEAVRFLAKQGLVLRGDSDTSASVAEPIHNIYQLLQSYGRISDSERVKLLLQRNHTYSSALIQNEILSIQSNIVLREVIGKVKKAQWYSIMIDETADASRKEQAAICFRIVENLVAYEYPVGFYEVPGTSAKQLFDVIKDVLLRLQIPLESCRGQRYDGASAMCGKRAGLKTLLAGNPKEHYVHSYAHVLQLAIQDSVKVSPLLTQVLGVCSEVAKLIKLSPKRSAGLDKLKEEVQDTSVGIRTLCPTRWTVRADAIHGISNYKYLLDLFSLSLAQGRLEPEVTGRIFGLKLAYKIFRLTDTLSSKLQSAAVNGADGKEMATAVIKHLKDWRSDGQFDLFYLDVAAECDELLLEVQRLLSRPSGDSNGSTAARRAKTTEQMQRRQEHDVLATEAARRTEFPEQTKQRQQQDALTTVAA